MRFFSFIASLLIAQGAFAEDCGRLTNGSLERFVCDTKPAVLAALNPGLKIPRCADSPAGPTVRSGDEPVAGVFVTCTPLSRNSCREIAKSILKNGKGVTVNVLIKNSDIVALEQDLLDIARTAGADGRLNVIPLESQPAFYMRDPGLFRSDGKGDIEFVASPYLNNGVPGDFSMRELAERCGYGFKMPFADLAKYDSAYRLLAEDFEGQLTVIYGSSMAKYILRNLKSPEDRERFIRGHLLQKFWGQGLGPDGKVEINDSPVMGGNFLGLPGGTLVAGIGDVSRPDFEILNQFAKTQNVMTIELPKLVVNHVDEVFNIVPSKGSCGFALLRASPREMKKFLESRPSNEALGNVKGILETIRNPPSKEVEKLGFAFWQKQNEIQAARNAGRALPPGLVAEYEAFRHQWEKASGVLSTVADSLADQQLMAAWTEMQKTIDASTEKLLKELKRTKGCMPSVIDLPVYWSKDGEPIMSNPVNGLAVNGGYFRSETKRIFSVDPITGKGGPEAYPALDEKIRTALRPVFDNEQFTADTRELDQGNGNFHCATTNVYLPCQ